jgi:DNA-directed RNA polymerase subunit beta'
MKRYRAVKLFDEDSRDLDQQMNEILEQRKTEAALAEAAGEESGEEEAPEQEE